LGTLVNFQYNTNNDVSSNPSGKEHQAVQDAWNVDYVVQIEGVSSAVAVKGI
jgi:hypothetical protein